jgi:uncharacterized protein (TIGR00725 family)
LARIIVGVMGGSSATEQTADLARDLGRRIAEAGWVLLNGGRASGVMQASAEGARAAGGLTLGILPGRGSGEESEHLDLCVFTGIGDARNLINVLSSRVVFACQGAGGTLSEIALALANRRPTILVGWDAGNSFARFEEEGLLHRTDTPEQAVALAQKLIGG